MDSNLHSNGSLSQLANAEEDKSFNGGNLALPNNPFSDDVVVEPLNKSSQNMGFTFTTETRPPAMENEATSSYAGKDDVFGVPLGRFSQEMDEPSDKERRFLASDDLATSTSPFSEVVNDSYGIGSVATDNLATSSSPFSDSLDVPLNSSIHVNSGSSYTETDNLSTGYVIDVRPSNNTPQRTMGLLNDENGQTPFVDISNPFRQEIHDETRTPDALECSKSPKSSLTSLDSDSVDDNLKNTETNLLSTEKDSMPLTPPDSPFDDPFQREIHDHLSTEKDSMPLTPISQPSNVVDVRPLNNTPQLTMGLSFDRNCQILNVEEPSSPLRPSLTDQSPTVQVMERPTTPKYRIPSHVFAREKSNTPGDWSVASNESLFSIQMGNSFTTDQFALRSGEFNNSSTPIKGDAGGYTSPKFGLRESDLKTINEVSKSGEIQFHDKPRISQESTMSTKSFQFPILADVDKCNSISMTGLLGTGTTEKQIQSPTLTAPKPTEAEVEMEVEAQQQPEPNPSPPAEQPKATASWFACFSCCSCWPHR